MQKSSISKAHGRRIKLYPRKTSPWGRTTRSNLVITVSKEIHSKLSHIVDHFAHQSPQQLDLRSRMMIRLRFKEQGDVSTKIGFKSLDSKQMIYHRFYDDSVTEAILSIIEHNRPFLRSIIKETGKHTVEGHDGAVREYRIEIRQTESFTFNVKVTHVEFGTNGKQLVEFIERFEFVL